MRVFIDVPPWFVRPNNTDWRYMRGLKQLEKFLPIQVVFSQSQVDATLESLSYVGGRITRVATRLTRDARWIRAQARTCDVAISHRRFPEHLGIPTIWQYAVLDPAMQIARGACRTAVDAEYRAQAPIYKLASMIQVSTKSEARRHADVLRLEDENFFSVPFFLPNVPRVSIEDILRKHANADIVNCLFVGREAQRKGLDIAFDALNSLTPDLRRKIRLTVVSSFADRSLALPTLVRTQHYRSLPRENVLRLMRQAHIFIMPSRFESFGFTFLEAMAAGCAIIGPDWEVQREILDDGTAGICVRPQADEVRQALESLLVDNERRLQLARAARLRYEQMFAPNVVAQKYLEMCRAAIFKSALSRGTK